MDSICRISTIWLDQPNQSHLHACVRLPAIRNNHSIPESYDVHSQLKGTKLATQPPSSIAIPHNYESLQDDLHEKILDDRPVADRFIPPVSLLYPGFGHFRDIIDGRRDVPKLTDVEETELWSAVDRLATELLEPDKDQREIGLVYLRRIFAARQGVEIPLISPGSIGSSWSDGYNIAEDGTSSIIVVFRNSHTGPFTHPQVEAAGYFAHLNAKLNPELYRRWRVPCLAVTIVDCYITFYALLAVDHQIRLISLTPTYSCLPSAYEGIDRESLCLAFTAASVLQDHILEDARKILSDPTAAEIPNFARRCPAISKILLSKYAASPNPDDYITFQICGLLDDDIDNRLLYKAKRPGFDELILIKFARQYSIELHSFCANAGHAPSILGFERLPGGWFAVAMEYVKPATKIIESKLLASNRLRWIEELTRLVDGFHAKNLVHGDLRDENIVCKGDTVMLIDFDWGGEVGQAAYPGANLNPELLEGRMSVDRRISKDDDVRLLSKSLANCCLACV